ncbi:MAG TPA: tetratricopeptide repeat protein [Ktedonobacteraceae bacterium]
MSTTREQAEAALAEINSMTEAAQVALSKALAKERHTDAADVLLAINELSPVKGARKEARRSLIQLQGAKIYPQWHPLVDQPLALVPQTLTLDEDKNTYVDEESDYDEENEDYTDLRDLSPQDVVTTFVESWVNDDYDTAYDLLSNNSPLREGLSLDEWVERREEWANAANQGDLVPDFIHEREPQKSKLWLPPSVDRSPDMKEFEAGWSIEMDPTPLSDTLPELPKAIAVYEETQRHWFWATFMLIQEQDAWRIQSMVDEGTAAQGLSVEELRKTIEELDRYLLEFRQKYNLEDIERFSDADTEHYADEIYSRVFRAAGYTDALIKKMPLERELYEEASGRLIAFKLFERCLVYLEPLAWRFEEKRALYLRQLAEVQLIVSERYFDEGDDERAIRLQELAEEALKESLAIEDKPEPHISLAELYIEDDRFDEAEEHLLQAKALATEPSQVAHIELHLGEVAMGRELYEEALSHYQRVAELEPDHPDTWVDLAKAYEELNDPEAAEANYRHAIELQPDNEGLYYDLSKMFTKFNQPEKAIEAIEEGLSANPDSAVLCIFLATMYLDRGDYRQAEVFLDKAERLDPDAPYVQIFRSLLNMAKSVPASPPTPRKLNRSKKKKRR